MTGPTQGNADTVKKIIGHPQFKIHANKKRRTFIAHTSCKSWQEVEAHHQRINFSRVLLARSPVGSNTRIVRSVYNIINFSPPRSLSVMTCVTSALLRSEEEITN